MTGILFHLVLTAEDESGSDTHSAEETTGSTHNLYIVKIISLRQDGVERKEIAPYHLLREEVLEP